MASITRYHDVYRLNVNSFNRNHTYYPDPADFTVELGYPLIGNIFEKSLKSLVLPNVFQTFRDINDTLNFTDSTGANSITITHGSYNITQLMAHLTTLLNAASVDVYVLSFDYVTLRLTITSNSALFSLDFTNTFNPAYWLGWESGTTTVAGLTQVAPNVVDLLAYKNLFLQIQPFNYDMHNVNEGTFSYIVPITSNYGDMNYFFSASQFPQVNVYDLGTGSKVNVKLLIVKLCDDTGATVDLQGKNFEFTLEFKLN